MKLPVPNPAEVGQFIELCKEKFGTDLTPQEGFDGLSHIVNFVYLTEYYGRDPRARKDLFDAEWLERKGHAGNPKRSAHPRISMFWHCRPHHGKTVMTTTNPIPPCR